MNIFKKFFCRSYQLVFKMIRPFLPYRIPIIFDSIEDIHNELLKNKIKSVLLITDSGLRKVGATDAIECLLQKAKIHCTIYDKTNANPTVRNVEEARSVYIKNKCECIIAFGGGSPIDCAKAVGARIAYPTKSLNKLKGLLKVRKAIPMLIAIPTTAGTGSEVTITAVISDPEKQHKYTINSFPLIPHYAILDPKVTYSLPSSLTATTGMDALTHAVEAYIGKATTKETRKLSLNVVKLIFNNIELAYNDGKNYDARKNMLDAAYQAGIAFSKSYVGYIHAIAHSLGGQYNIPHGLANSVLMPIVLESYGESVYKKLYELGVSSGVVKESDTYEVGAEKFINAIKKLNKNMNIPSKLSGIKAEDIPIMAYHANKEANPLYPVPKLMDSKELEKIYYRVMEK